MLSDKQKQMIVHAYGETGFRTHYCTALDDIDMEKLQELKIFGDPMGIGMVGEGHAIFHLTPAGQVIAQLLTDKLAGGGG